VVRIHPRLPMIKWCNRPGCNTLAHVVQQQRQPPQKRSSAGANPAVGTNFKAGCKAQSVWSRAVENPTAPCSLRSAPVAQQTERRASNAEVEGASPSGSAIF
jgi:hypothetical protein